MSRKRTTAAQAQTLREALEATQSALKDVEAVRKHLKTPVARKRELSQPGQTLLSKAKKAVKKPKMDVDELHQQLLEHSERLTESYDVSDNMRQYLDSAVDVPPHHRLIAQAAADAYTARQYLEDLEDEGVFDMPTAEQSEGDELHQGHRSDRVRVLHDAQHFPYKRHSRGAHQYTGVPEVPLVRGVPAVHPGHGG